MPIIGFTNYGYTTIKNDPGIGQPALFNSLMQSFNLTLDDTTEDTMAYPIAGTGVLETAYTYLTERLWTLELGLVFDWACLQLQMQLFQANTASLTHRTTYVECVPDVAPYEIVDTRLTGLTESQVRASILTSSINTFEPLEIVGAAPANPDEAQLDEPNTKLVFDATQAGKTVAYQLDEAYSSVRTIGLEKTSEVLDTVSFNGDMRNQTAPNSIQVNVPAMGRIGGFELAPRGDNTVQFRPRTDKDNFSPVRFFLEQ